MAPTTRSQRNHALFTTTQAPPPLTQLTTPPKRPRKPRPPPISPLTPPLLMRYYINSADNRHMNAPFPDDNRDIPSFDLGEPEEEFSLWEQADAAWKVYCEGKAKARKVRIKRQGGVTRGQRRWARRRKGKAKEEILEWFGRKMMEREG